MSVPSGPQHPSWVPLPGDGLSLPRHLDLADMEHQGTDHISHSYFIMSFSDRTQSKIKKRERKKNIVWFFPKAHPESRLSIIAWQLLALCVLKFKVVRHTEHPSELQKASELQSERVPTHAHSHTHTNIRDLFCQFNLDT